MAEEARGGGLDVEGHRRAVAAEFTRMVDAKELELPLPGAGHTRSRWSTLTRIAEDDLALARLCEGHTDALAILAELDALGVAEVPQAPAGSRWGVWAAEPPGQPLEASQTATGWSLSGLKPYCSGARVCTDALVTARVGEQRRLFAVSTAQGVAPVPGSWPAAGMAASDTLDLLFDQTPAVPVGGPGAYLDRPGFQHGGIGVAACWYGGARAVADALLRAALDHGPEPHTLAHLGAVDSRLQGVGALLDRAAAEVDADPQDRRGGAALRSMRVRAATEDAAAAVLHHVGRALGAGPLGHDAAHARRVTDLTVYLRQHHGERDLAGLGAALLDAARGQQ
ncbi:acyl-CoA dehydrogenase [Streptacidiphilus sp. PB12-B1b]|uniref:acyl-CoA dehydrogenase n=1 Tax=Streptacidiphilus sp. PB12-B1b TaxID=2705012 RepID=UPI0015FC06FE|nr:acyl-CoA dehydrogenase [Streptacidiphilus sp. PB12-B1b]QMU76705.1 acyl-CoA dehydrogenase [Streptacidiphilus sp. PB12-B1b]